MAFYRKGEASMLTIIELSGRADGFHGLQSQSHRTECWLEGWVAVPEELCQIAWDCGGYCDLKLDKKGNLVDIIPRERPAQPDPEPTAEEQLRADVDYLAIMMGVSL